MTHNLQNIPTYPIPEVAKFLKIPPATLRTWVLGRQYKTHEGIQFSKPIISIANRKNHLMSFINVVEAHVLSAIRRKHNVSMEQVRQALQYVEKKYHVKHPLADKIFETDGVNLFMHEYGELMNLNRSGQYAMTEVLKIYLDRIDRNKAGQPLRIYPLLPMGNGAAKDFMIDPRISFGRLVISGTGIPVDVLEERFNAGESIETLAKDYGCEKEKIEKAIFQFAA